MGEARILTELRIIRSLTKVEYEWDTTKAAENLRRHGVDFVEAIAALEDPHRFETMDTRSVYSEERMQVLGMSADGILFVIPTMRGNERCRIISTRRATRHEADRYYAGDREAW